MEGQIPKRAPLNLMTIQAKTRSLFERVKRKYIVLNAKFVASHGWFNRYKASVNFHNVIVSGEVAKADTKAAIIYPEVFREIVE
jgi:RNA-binding protein YlmH